MSKKCNIIFIMFLTLITIFPQKVKAEFSTDVSTELSTSNVDNSLYITKIYNISEQEKENIEYIIKERFQENGYLYVKSNIEENPIIKTETKDISQTKTVTVANPNKASVIKALGNTINYSDDEGYSGKLTLDNQNIIFSISGYSTKCFEKNDTKLYHGLSSKDVNQFPKIITIDNIDLQLINIEWIESNNSESGNTAVGINYTAKVYYKGEYTKKIPSGYKAEVIYKGTVKKSYSNAIEYKVTYIGEEIPISKSDTIIEEPQKNNSYLFSIILLIGGLFFCIVIIILNKQKVKESEN